MKTKCFSIRAFYLFAICCRLCQTMCFGWGPLAHCAIGENTGTGAGFNNVPDYWASRSFTSVSEYFCWSHEYKVTATSGVFRRSYEPTLNTVLQAEDDSPSHYFNILTAKMEPAHVTATVQSVIRGWRAHNAADRIVHYSFFHAPPAGSDWAAILSNWSAHVDDEDAVDLFVYVMILYNGHTNLAFNASGRAVGYNFTGGLVCGDVDSDRFLSLAQKTFRKKQATLDTRDMWGLTVQPDHEIATCRSNMERTLANMFNFTLNDYNNAYYNRNRRRVRNGWQAEFTRALNAVRALP